MPGRPGAVRPPQESAEPEHRHEVEETNVVEPARSLACAGSDPSRSAARGLYHGAVPQVPPTERRRRLLRAVERHSGALAAAALAIVTAIGTSGTTPSTPATRVT